jgi:hypothetical protein
MSSQQLQSRVTSSKLAYSNEDRDIYKVGRRERM